MATITTAGQSVEIINLTTSTTPKQLTFANAVNSFCIQARTAVDLLFYPQTVTGQAGSNYFTIKSGQSLTLDVTGWEKDHCVGWVASTSGTPVCEAVAIY